MDSSKRIWPIIELLKDKSPALSNAFLKAIGFVAAKKRKKVSITILILIVLALGAVLGIALKTYQSSEIQAVPEPARLYWARHLESPSTHFASRSTTPWFCIVQAPRLKQDA